VAEQFNPKNESKTKKKTKLSLFAVERYAVFAHEIELRKKKCDSNGFSIFRSYPE